MFETSPLFFFEVLDNGELPQVFLGFFDCDLWNLQLTELLTGMESLYSIYIIYIYIHIICFMIFSISNYDLMCIYTQY